jgi:hypothetical protein
LNFNDLEIFKSVCEESSINKAAVNLQYAQSNISQRILSIENELGTKLLIRTNKGIKMTKYGEEFYIYCKRVLKETKIMKENLKYKESAVLCSELLFDYITETQKLSINDKKFYIVPSSDIESKIGENYYDIILTFNKVSKLKYKTMKNKELELMIYGNSDIGSETPLLINSDSSCPIRKLSLKYKDHWSRIVEIDSLSGILKLVEKGEGVAFLPTYLEKTKNILRLDKQKYKVNYFVYEQ